MFSDEVDEFDVLDICDEVEVDNAYEKELLEELKAVAELVEAVVDGSELLFFSQPFSRGVERFRATHTGRQLLGALQAGLERFAECFPLCNLNPYVELLFRCAGRVDKPMLFHYVMTAFPHETLQHLTIMNGIVADMRQEASQPDFKATIKRFAKASQERTASLARYIDAQFAKKSRLVVIRVDLSYEMGFFRGRDLRDSLEGVKQDWAKMRQDLTKGVPIPSLLGYACKLEYAHRSGFHFHLLVFYSGASYRQDAVLARLIGEHWQRVVSEGRGRYFNCNAKKDRYKYPGIGVISRSDIGLILNLKQHVADYLAKVDYWLRLPIACGRSFFRGVMPSSRG